MIRARITDIQKETYDTNRFFLELENTPEFLFKPGQFISFQLPIHDNPKKCLRHYSIASAPNQNHLEFIINKVDGGLGTTYLFEKAQVGTEFPILGPVGKFILPDKITTDICMICTGTGIAPFRSMLHHIFDNNISHNNIYLIFGSRKTSDLLYHNEFEEMQNLNSDFKYIVALSREEFKGYKGYVHAVYQDLFTDSREAHFYLCGFKNMIMDARKWLGEKGYDRKQIHFEIYD